MSSNKRVVRTSPFSDNVEMVYYSDGSKGLRYVGGGTPTPTQNQIEIPDQGREGSLTPWQDSMDGEPATPEEMEEVMNLMRKQSGPPLPNQDETLAQMPKKKGY